MALPAVSLPAAAREFPALRATSDPAVDIQRIVSAVKAVAAAEIVPRFKNARTERKLDGSLVTDADTAAQAALEAALQEIFNCPVMGEEMLESEQRRIWQESEWCWCVDPLDGTGNFVNGKPYFGVSVALVSNQESRIGVVFDPCANEVFCAQRGAGATVNGRVLRVDSRAATLSEALVEVGLYRKLGVLKAALFDAPPFKKLTMSGASVLQWCHLAASRVDLFVHPGENPWDYAAGALILEEAGGRLATFTHDRYWQDPAWHRSAIATSNPALFDEWVRWVRSKI
jgi:myo-inositol-1(or 4)-monophosphatase